MDSPLHSVEFGDQDVVHDHAVANHSLMESRLLYRTGSLRVRCFQVNRCIEKAQNLINLYKKCAKLGLSSHDLETRRSELKAEVSDELVAALACVYHDICFFDALPGTVFLFWYS